jgi:hypothetical protein
MARLEFGSVPWHQDAARGLRFWDELRADASFAMRGVLHRPLQSLIVVVTLTLGIGISASVFTMIDAIALRPHVDRDPSSFVRLLSSYRTDTSPPSFPAASTLSDYLAYARGMRSLRAITGWQHVSLKLGGAEMPTSAELVTCGFFGVYGPVTPVLGRRDQRCLLAGPTGVRA